MQEHRQDCVGGKEPRNWERCVEAGSTLSRESHRGAGTHITFVYFSPMCAPSPREETVASSSAPFVAVMCTVFWADVFTLFQEWPPKVPSALSILVGVLSSLFLPRVTLAPTCSCELRSRHIARVCEKMCSVMGTTLSIRPAPRAVASSDSHVWAPGSRALRNALLNVSCNCYTFVD